jgi:hypothetical protein
MEPENQNNAKVWYTSAEAAQLMGLKPSSLKSLVFRGRIKPDHRGGCDGLKSHRFHISTLEAFLGKRKAG